MHQVRHICICVDEFGLHEGVNDAALMLRRGGRVHALSCLVGAPAWRSGAQALRRDSSGPIDLGLHLDLTRFPLTLAPRTWRSLWFSGVLDRLSAQALRAEIGAQLQAFEDHAGRRPDFVDGHRHVHQFPQVREALMDVLLQRYVYYRPWIRSTRAAGSGLTPRLVAGLGGRALAQEAHMLAFPQNGRLLGVYDHRGGGARYRSLLSHWLASAQTADLLVCHPSTEEVPGDAHSRARQDEYGVLSDDALVDRLHADGVRLAAMSRILEDARYVLLRQAA